MLGDATWVAPVLLVQVGILQPAALMVLDAQRHTGRVPVTRYLVMPFRNPITVAVVIGVLLRVTHLQLPDVLGSAMDSVGKMAVPLMLLAFGVSLRVDPLPGKGSPVAELWFVQAIKLLVQPLVRVRTGHLGLPPRRPLRARRHAARGSPDSHRRPRHRHEVPHRRAARP